VLERNFLGFARLANSEPQKTVHDGRPGNLAMRRIIQENGSYFGNTLKLSSFEMTAGRAIPVELVADARFQARVKS